MPVSNIPFSKPFFPEETSSQFLKALNSDHPQGNGPVSQRAEEIISLFTGTKGFLTGSCSQALDVATLALNLKPGDEVIIPSYTFPSAANSLINFGIKPIFCDISLTDMNIDVNQIEELITQKTRAISYVNYAGCSPDVDSLKQIALNYNLKLIEDNAHGFGGFSGTRRLGSVGDVSTLSFHATKNIQCGEGGAICTNDESLIEKIGVIREKGTNRKEYLVGGVQKYQWVDKGGSFLQSDLLASVLLSQLNNFDDITEKRVRIWNLYDLELRELFIENGFIPQTIESKAKNLAHMYWVLAKNSERRSAFIDYMHRKGIACSFHYQSLHQSPAGIKFGSHLGQLVNSDIASSCLFRLPVWPDLAENQIETIINAAKEFFWTTGY
jgi:dTDP-4-amino-4,6-dideoxygalactose transaminase